MSVRKAITMINWEFLFSHKSVYDQGFVFDNELVDIFSNFNSIRSYVTFDEKDPP